MKLIEGKYREDLIRLYNARVSQEKIAKELHVGRDKVCYDIAKLVADGTLEKRERVISRDKAITKIEFNRAIIRDEYLKGIPIEEIMKKVGLSERTVNKYIWRLKRDGELPEGRRKETAPRKPRIPVKHRTHVPGKTTLAEGETVNCTCEVSKKCIYGCKFCNKDTDKCRYILIEHHSRGCSHKACNKFSRVSATNPRRYAEGEKE